MNIPLQKLLPNEPISAWPDFGDWDDEDEEWIVGVARQSWDGPAYILTKGHTPRAWNQLARVQGRAFAEALAAHLNALPKGKSARAARRAADDVVRVG